ncbi:hypothetical protein JX265_008304 [Neoarthrinium moseri]|uniref:Uncharacterized protein n=1 Tax=Neoarthrinium moseri TaxID=1658444 RepID=A0A9P9WIK5_9PEZI|nr:hypothetical protein JX265_008304 [Neoarthrinium moseri]
MAPIEDLLLDLGAKIAHEHNLGVSALEQLADALDGNGLCLNDVAVPAVDFPTLVQLLLDITYDVPEWLAVSDERLKRYTEDEFKIVIKLIETRFWLGDAERTLDQLWSWQVVFGRSRQEHRQLISKSDIDGIDKMKGPAGYYTFLSSITNVFYDDYPDSYRLLREKFFPRGIDDAIPAFIKHYRQAKTAVRKLRKRYLYLGMVGVDKGGSLYMRSRDLLLHGEMFLEQVMGSAQLWRETTKKQNEYYQLPGVNMGLPYGTTAFTDYSLGKTYVIHQGGIKNHWDGHGDEYTPLRYQQGSPWGDWFRNVMHARGTMTRIEATDLKNKGIDAYKTAPGPYELRLPQAICPIWMHFGRMYSNYEAIYSGFTIVHPRSSMLEGPVKTEEELAEQAEQLSDGTSEPYWHVRKIKFQYAKLEMLFARNPLLAGRPRFDGMGNLRFDYMGVILRELTTGHRFMDYRVKQSCILIVGDDEGKETNP